MSKIKIALDVDGILANFYLAVCQKFNQIHSLIKTFHIPWLKFNEISKDSNFWVRLPIISPPESIVFDIECYMTSIPEKMKYARKRWLLINEYPDKEVIVSNQKHVDCKLLGIDLLIDDKPETIRQFRDVSMFAIQFIPYYSNMTVETKANIRHLPEAVPYIELIEKYKEIENLLHDDLKKRIIKEFHASEFEHFKMLMEFIYNLSSGNTISGWQSITFEKYYRDLMTIEILGIELFNKVESSIDIATGSL